MINLKLLFNFFLKKKIFFLIQFIILITLTFSLAIPNFKESVYYKLIYNADLKWQKLNNKINYLRHEYGKLLRKMGEIDTYIHYDYFDSYDFGKLYEYKDPSDFLDLGYSEIKNIFYVKKSKFDLYTDKIEILKSNNNFDIKDYQIKYNHEASTYFISQLKEFEKLVGQLKNYLTQVDRRYLFEKVLYEYQLKIDFTKQIFGKSKSYIYVSSPTELGIACYGQDIKDDPNDLRLLYLFYLCLIESDITDFTPNEEILRKFNSLVNMLDHDSGHLTTEEFLTTEVGTRERFMNGLNDFYSNEMSDFYDEITQNIYFMDIESLKKRTDMALANNIKLSNHSMDRVISLLHEQMRYVKEFNYIDFEIINSKYLIKYKVVEVLRYFLLISFMLIIFNIIYYFYFFKKNN